MDILSSQASIAGYQASLLAANHLNKYFPMLITAAGTISPAKILVVGAGVAGLQAIATCNRLGAKVTGFDVRESTKEQVESVGGKFYNWIMNTMTQMNKVMLKNNPMKYRKSKMNCSQNI